MYRAWIVWIALTLGICCISNYLTAGAQKDRFLPIEPGAYVQWQSSR